MITDWTNKKVAVLGLGVEGLSSVRFLVKHGAQVTVLDRKKEEEVILLLRHSGKPRQLTGRIQNLSGQGVTAVRDSGVASLPRMTKGQAGMTGFEMIPKIVGGKNYLKNLLEYDVIVRSPGVRRNLPEIVAAEKNGVEITSQTKIFFDLCPCPIIGITGTKGKGTTATLIYEMLKKQGYDAYLGGNIGKPLFEFLGKLNSRPASTRGESWVVLELSSFQLQDLHKSPHIAVVLMITSEHLDYHKDVYEYVDAKRNILRFQNKSDFAIINRDYRSSHESDIHTEAKIFQVSRERECKEGCFVKEGKVVVRGALRSLRQFKNFSNASVPAARYRSPRDTPRHGAGSSQKFFHAKAPRAYLDEVIIDTKDILLPGKHNLENVCAAVMAATLAGVSKENIVKVLKTFKGLEHRLELVAEIDGVKYYDDSFSTTPETAIAAIEAFTQPEILILGGSSKGSDFRELGRVISNTKNIKAIIGIGAEWQRIKAQFKVQSSKFKVDEGLKDMKSIARKASSIAKSGDIVLLSPACASFDMFKNYKDRGEQFKKEVKML